MMNRLQATAPTKHLRVIALLTTILVAPLAGADLLITNARLVTGTDQGTLINASVRIADGLITAVDTTAVNLAATEIVDAAGAYVTTGFLIQPPPSARQRLAAALRTETIQYMTLTLVRVSRSVWPSILIQVCFP